MSRSDTPPGREARRIAALNQLILRSIVDHAVVTLDSTGTITSWNEGAERILGWTEDEIVGRPADAFFTDEDTTENRSEIEMRLALEHGRAEDVRWHVRKDGTRFWGSGLMMPLLDAVNEDGSPIQDPARVGGFVKIFRDRTQEHEAERSIARLQDRARLAMRRSGTVGVFENDVRDDIVVADETCARLHGVLPDKAERGTGVDDFFAGIVTGDRAAVRERFRASIETGGDLDTTYRVRADGAKPVWVHAQGTLQMDEDGRPARLIGIVVDITEQREHLRMQEARLAFSDRVRDIRKSSDIADLAARMVVDTLHVDRAGHGSVEADGETIVVEADVNRGSGESLVGLHRFDTFGSYADTLRRGRDVVIPDARKDDRVHHSERLEALGIRSLVNLPLMENGKLRGVLFVNDSHPRDWTEAELSFLASMFDRTYAAIDRLRLEAERDMLAEEIAHRMKNLLTMAQVVVKQSLRGVTGLESHRAAIESRLGALSTAQDVLTRAQEREADIRSVLGTALAPHAAGDDNRLSLHGPSLTLTSQQVIGLSLGLHELATNAAKYGAWSSEAGHVLVSWAETDGIFRFDWVETGGPTVAAPVRRGFGSTILQNTVGSYFHGSSTLDYDARGLRFEIRGALRR